MPLRTLPSLGELRGKRIILRCDLNAPLDAGRITDDGRLRASMPTVQELVGAGAKVIMIAHLGRPDGESNGSYSLAPVAERLSELLGTPVRFVEDIVGEAAQAAVASMGDSDVVLLENLRFDSRETSKDEAERHGFAAQLASMGDVVVSDGFGVVHRKQASVFELETLLPSAAGLLVERELEVLERLTLTPERPFSVVLGGSKVTDKLDVIAALLPKVDRLMIGGGMAFTFLAARGNAVGSSLLESDQLSAVSGYLAEAEKLGVDIILPDDIVVAASFAADAAHAVVAAEDIENTPYGSAGIGLDIGPTAADRFSTLIESSSTVFWNGPMGVFEFPAFSAGTKAVAAALTNVKGFSVVGGGDSAAAVRSLGFNDDQFGHISTGGGASLEFLEGKALPGLEVLGWQR